MLDEMKSKRSKNPLPMTFIPPKKLELSAEQAARTPTTAMITQLRIAAFLRGMLNSSDIQTVGTSTKESIAPLAANEVSRKNANSRTCPKGICEKTSGIVIKRRPGPAPGSTPNENTVGNIASPASIETQISAIAILRGAEERSESEVKYDPYVIIVPIPRESLKKARPIAASVTEGVI